jgi:hypothetical protein
MRKPQYPAHLYHADVVAVVSDPVVVAGLSNQHAVTRHKLLQGLDALQETVQAAAATQTTSLGFVTCNACRL